MTSLTALNDRIQTECQAIAGRLADRDWKIVFAESCTGGLIAASLAAVPGISRFLCGSAVVYRETTKTQWLGIAPDVFSEHTAVSAIVAEQMAKSVLANTPEADLAVSVTGHLGPDAPADQDGLIYSGLARRNPASGRMFEPVVAIACRLTSAARVERQHEAALHVLMRLREELGIGPDVPSPP